MVKVNGGPKFEYKGDWYLVGFYLVAVAFTAATYYGLLAIVRWLWP